MYQYALRSEDKLQRQVTRRSSSIHKLVRLQGIEFKAPIPPIRAEVWKTRVIYASSAEAMDILHTSALPAELFLWGALTHMISMQRKNILPRFIVKIRYLFARPYHLPAEKYEEPTTDMLEVTVT